MFPVCGDGNHKGNEYGKISYFILMTKKSEKSARDALLIGLKLSFCIYKPDFCCVIFSISVRILCIFFFIFQSLYFFLFFLTRDFVILHF